MLAIPGLGPVVAAGWLASTAVGAAVGGATGGLLGALKEAGHSDEEANVYAEGVRRGVTSSASRRMTTRPITYTRSSTAVAVSTARRASSVAGSWPPTPIFDARRGEDQNVTRDQTGQPELSLSARLFVGDGAQAFLDDWTAVANRRECVSRHQTP